VSKFFSTILIACVVVGCSSSSDDTGPSGTPNHLNECTTKGATYVMHCVEKSGGNCGPLTDEVYIADEATAAQLESVLCAAVNQNGCTETATDCKQHVDVKGGSCDVLETYSTTFKDDGSSAVSIDTRRITCSDGSWCKSTYDCTITRK